MRAEILLLAVLLLAACGGAHLDGWEVGGGGGKCKADWVDATTEAQTIVAEGNLARVASRDFDAAVSRTAIVYRSRVALDGSDVDAVNFAHAVPPRIELGCDRFSGLTRDERTELATHELASILGLDDSRREISGALDITRVCSRTPGVRAGVEAATDKRCNVIRAHDLAHVNELRLRLKHIDVLRAGDFAGLSGLRRLDLSYNSLSTIPPALFAPLVALKFLDLRGNELTAIPTGLFAGAALNEISGYSALDGSDYWENPITRLERGFLGEKSRAESVTLCPTSDGFLSEIADGAFDGLSDSAQVAICLALREPLRPEALRGLERAARLTLVGTGWRHLPAHFFKSAGAAAIDFATNEALPSEVLAQIAANPRITVVRFYRGRGAVEGFNCHPLVPNGREPGFIRVDNGAVCYRR